MATVARPLRTQSSHANPLIADSHQRSAPRLDLPLRRAFIKSLTEHLCFVPDFNGAGFQDFGKCRESGSRVVG